MRSRKRWLIIITALALSILWATWIRDRPPAPQPVTSPPTDTVSSQGLKESKKSSSQSTAEYDFSPIQTEIRKHRLQLASCFLRGSNVASKEYRMTLKWEPQGLLKTVRLAPNAEEAVTNCIAELARKWPTKAHPALQPFSYSVTLIPSGL